VADEFADGRHYSHFSNEPDSLVPGYRLMFHSDYVFTPEPAPVLSLFAVDVDDGSMPTQWASCVRAARLLPPEDRERLSTLRAVHAQNHSDDGPARLATTGSTRVNLLELPADAPAWLYPRWVHPVIKPNPRTGEPMLFVSPYFTSHIEGFDVAASDALLEELWERLYQPDNIYLHRWAPGDLVVWDNLALQHARGATDTGSPRTLRRVIVSDRPIDDLLAAAGAVGRKFDL
jgi:taurine dioxygenase